MRNSLKGTLSVVEIYNFIRYHFPFYRSAPSGWKNSVRHTLSINASFEKILAPKQTGYIGKGCLWAINPNKADKLDEEIDRANRRYPEQNRKSMPDPGKY